MRSILLTQGKEAWVSNTDYARLSQYKWCARRSTSGIWYAMRNVKREGKGVTVLMHRQVRGLRYGDRRQVDHKDGDGLNNQRSNLRLATHRTNGRNQAMHRDNKSGAKGVHWRKERKKWQARITLDYKIVHLGYFENLIDAAKAYNKAATKLHGKFARLNSA